MSDIKKVLSEFVMATDQLHETQSRYFPSNFWPLLTLHVSQVIEAHENELKNQREKILKLVSNFSFNKDECIYVHLDDIKKIISEIKKHE